MGSQFSLEVAGLDSFSVVILGSAGCIFEEFFDFIAERAVEVRCDVFLLERFSNCGFDYKVRHSIRTVTALS